MVGLLSRFFVPNLQDVQNPRTRQAYGVLCGIVGIVLNLLLFAGKFLAGIISGSIAITADAFNNLSDAGSSVITLIGFRLAGQDPDSDHPFGHGRMEYVSGLIVAMLILLVAVELLQGAVEKIFYPVMPAFSWLVLAILLVSVFVKGYMALYNHKIGKKIDSAAMRATATDSLSDAIATTVVLICTVISHFTGFVIDSYCGLAVSLFIFYAGIQAAKDTINPLLGQAPDPAFVEQIRQLVLAEEEIIGIHDLIVHNYGPGRILISLHAEVPADGDILVLHDKIDLIEHKLRDTLHCSAVIHMDPVCENDEQTSRLKEDVQAYLTQLDGALTLHDFRLVKGPSHTNVIFDVVVPFGFSMSDRELTKAISAHIRQINPNYYTVIEVDKTYS